MSLRLLPSVIKRTDVKIIYSADQQNYFLFFETIYNQQIKLMLSYELSTLIAGRPPLFNLDYIQCTPFKSILSFETTH